MPSLIVTKGFGVTTVVEGDYTEPITATVVLENLTIATVTLEEGTLSSVLLESDIDSTVVLESEIGSTVILENDIQVTIGLEDPLVATEYNFEIDKGDHLTLKVSVDDADGNDLDLTNAYVWMTVKDDPTLADSNAIFTRKNLMAGGGNDEINITDPTGGVFKVYIVPANTNSIDAGVYEYDAQIKLSGGDVKTVLRGSVEVLQTVTDTTS